jgi:DNA-binding NtrC family response regulator/tetratricopeptide (TPR) repeat protein
MAQPDTDPLAPLIEVLDHGRDGSPRWVVADSHNGMQAGALARRATAVGRARGYVPIAVDAYQRMDAGLADDLRDRTLLLIGHLAASLSSARRALIDAATRSPRPHVLLTFRSAQAPRQRFIVREARQVYGVEAIASIPGPLPVSADVLRLMTRVQRATEHVQSGRHAAAERLLREVAGSLERRQAHTAAARTLIALGQLLLERGRTSAAEASFEEAVRLAEAAGDAQTSTDARIWQASARTDQGRLVDAESICRALVMTLQPSSARRAWTCAALARTLLLQKRLDEAVVLDLSLPDESNEIDPTTAAFIHATAVRMLIASGDLFAAGQRARMLLRMTSNVEHLLPRIIAHTAHLRVLCESGDLVLAEQTLREVLVLARRARTPLRAARARVIWWDVLRRAGLDAQAQREGRHLGRMCRRLPPLLRKRIELKLATTGERATQPIGRRMVGDVIPGVALVRLAQEEESDAKAVNRILASIAHDLRTSRLELLSADAGPVTVIMGVGSGLATHLGQRVLEAGITIPAEVHTGGREIGVPVRLGHRLVAAIVCRWPLDRDPPARSVEILELAAAVAAPRIEALLVFARDTALASTAMPELVGVSASMAAVRRAVERAAPAPFAVLIEGESGVGKELVARAVHQLSPRRQRRFCDLNCAALPDDLLESELFGHARGAFTGAVSERAGLVEAADGGTLFLDELPDLSPRAQAKLLRVLQQQEVRRVGETFSRPIDIRIVTAANRDMKTQVADGRFRQDLLYRLDVIRIGIPPLRDRPEDVPVLARHFWTPAATRVGSTATLTHGVLAELSRYHWPGNVRELQNVIAALAVAAPTRGRVSSTLLPAAITGATAVTAVRLADARAQFERRCIEVALARAGGNRTRAAAALGLSRQGLLKTMARLGIETAGSERAG